MKLEKKLKRTVEEYNLLHAELQNENTFGRLVPIGPEQRDDIGQEDQEEMKRLPGPGIRCRLDNLGTHNLSDTKANTRCSWCNYSVREILDKSEEKEKRIPEPIKRARGRPKLNQPSEKIEL
jgi:hypothetical protein